MQDQFFNPAGVALCEIADYDLGPGTGNNTDGGEKQPVVDLDARNIGVEYEVIGAADQLANAERYAFVGELNLVAVDGVFEATGVKFFVCHWIGQVCERRISDGITG